MQTDTVQHLKACLRQAIYCAQRLEGAKLEGLRNKQQLDLPFTFLRDAQLELADVQKTLEAAREDLPSANDPPAQPKEKVSVRAHKRVLKKRGAKANDQEETPGQGLATGGKETAFEQEEEAGQATDEEIKSGLDFGRTAEQHLGTTK